ncbi:MAG: hypothetical protein AW12_00814 [Candidatus Accumulibacter sp. BA-94]|uniref:hypothetical protein n=1 Tax=Accumulibacter sp. TaxID=2053492 RepID=UPI0004455C4D|nr:hypothetical protein [Accumulibacter sp.]EXI92071.1 MAG: hypothetical protein AW12_00814 [Candidatus Accumulibacter sp. BA-94]HRD86762.1 hypothetical protein [Accumulibacter sp.]
MVDLLFSDGPASPDLVFGGTGTPPVIIKLGSSATLAAATMAGVLRADARPITSLASVPAISSPIAVSRVPALAMAATTGAPLANLAVGYDNAVNRAPFRWAETAWQDAQRLSHFRRAAHKATPASETAAVAGIGTATRRSAQVSTAWQPMTVGTRPLSHLPWGAGTPRERRLADGWQQLYTWLRPALRMAFNEGTPHHFEVTGLWRELFRRPRPVLVAPWETGALRSARLVSIAGLAAARVLALIIPWQEAGRPGHGVSPVPGDPPGPELYVASTALLFDDAMPVSLHLVFGRPHHPALPVADVVIPVLRTYLVINDVTLTRTANSLAMAPLSLSVMIDADSWVWGWEASLPGASLDDVLPSAPGEPVEFEATINGVNWLLLAEKVTRDRRFPQSRITVSGRGIAAELGNPYAASVSRNNLVDLNAQQVMAAALTVNGVGIGWSLDWQLTDWLVPAGAWSHTGSHIEAVTRIAEAAGGYVQASRNSKTLRIMPRYPVAPWDWGGVVPAFSLPSAATTRESIEWLENPAYNVVWVSGEGSGVLARVKRAGTGGDRPAPMITDPLNTHSEAARQRGLAILAETGPQQMLRLDTPLFSGVGIYPVGSFIQFADGAESRLGIVRSLRINAALPTVRQTVEIECHG